MVPLSLAMLLAVKQASWRKGGSCWGESLVRHVYAVGCEQLMYKLRVLAGRQDSASR